jgi:hypothetical protein
VIAESTRKSHKIDAEVASAACRFFDPPMRSLGRSAKGASQSSHAVIDPHLVLSDDLLVRAGWHGGPPELEASESVGSDDHEGN